MRFMRNAMFVLGLLACGPAAAPPPPVAPPPASPDPAPAEVALTGEDACTSDADCLVSDWPGCCGCAQCRGEPTARSRAGLEKAKDRCKVVRCRQTCDPAGCPPTEPIDQFTAVCRAGTCAAMRR
jgi:hypothetical protein